MKPSQTVKAEMTDPATDNDTSAQTPTMAQIAKLAGVSESTVSRALAQSPLVKPETRERVQQIAREMGFSLNYAARNLKVRRSQTIELVIPVEEYGRQNMSDPFFLDMIGGLADALTDAGYDMLLSKRTPWTTAADGSPRWDPILSGRADGLIIIGQGKDQRGLRQFAHNHRQLVVWGDPEMGGDYLLVGVNNRHGGKLATAHLLEQGRRRIAFMGDISEPEIRQRFEGYRSTLIDSGIGFDPALHIDSRFDPVHALPALKDFLDSETSFDAIFAATDVIAVTALSYLPSHGLSVPRDVAVVGYDNIHSAQSALPPLTTVSQKIDEGCRTLVSTLLDVIENRPASDTIIDPELVIRASCGA